MQIRLEITEAELKRLVIAHLQNKVGTIKLDENHLKIEVKSKQNYTADWEKAAYRAVYESFDA